MLSYLCPYIKKYKCGIIFFCLLTLLSTGINLVSPYINGLFIDCISYGGSADRVVGLAMITIALSLTGIIFSYINQIFTARLKTNFSYNMTADLVSHVQRAPFLILQKFDSTYLTTRITGDIDSVLSFFLGNIVSVFLSVIIVVVSLIILFRLSTVLFIASMLCIPTYIGLYYILKGPLFKTRKKYIETKNKFTAKITEQLYLIEEIKTEGDYQKSTNRITRTFGSVFHLYLKAIKVTSIFSSIDAIIALLFQSIYLIWGGLLVARGGLTIGQYTIINIYYSYVMNKLQYFLSLGQTYQEAKVSFDRIQELLQLEPEENGDCFLNNINTLIVRNISFDYNNKEIGNSSLISNLNFEMEKGNMTCLVGDNGSGKSTLINLLLGIIKKNVIGDIKYNGVALNDINMNKVKMESIAVVKQNPKYPKMTVRELLSEHYIGKNPLSEVNQIIERWGLVPFYYNDQFDLSNSLDKEMSEFSGGERQKLALLFAVIKEPDLIILDEPSSAMDQKSVELLIGFMNKYKREHLVLCVTHSSALIHSADNTIRMGKELTPKNYILSHNTVGGKAERGLSNAK